MVVEFTKILVDTFWVNEIKTAWTLDSSVPNPYWVGCSLYDKTRKAWVDLPPNQESNWFESADSHDFVIPALSAGNYDIHVALWEGRNSDGTMIGEICRSVLYDGLKIVDTGTLPIENPPIDTGGGLSSYILPIVLGLGAIAAIFLISKNK